MLSALGGGLEELPALSLSEVAFANREYVSTKCAVHVDSGWSFFSFLKEIQAGGLLCYQ